MIINTVDFYSERKRNFKEKNVLSYWISQNTSRSHLINILALFPLIICRYSSKHAFLTNHYFYLNILMQKHSPGALFTETMFPWLFPISTYNSYSLRFQFSMVWVHFRLWIQKARKVFNDHFYPHEFLFLHSTPLILLSKGDSRIKGQSGFSPVAVWLL